MVRCTLADTVLNFYPRPPRGGRPRAGGKTAEEQEISIHALREEGDMTVAGGRPGYFRISIHALREEGDDISRQRCSEDHPISIHALREEGDSLFCFVYN